MSRPVKCRRVCHAPKITQFDPVGQSAKAEPVILCVEEYEALRLIDHQGLSQEQCSAFMQIARTTVQRIYDSARKKLALSLVEGRGLQIRGGDFSLCSGENGACGMADCHKRASFRQIIAEKGATIMRIAVTYENGQIFQHFGHTAQFKVYDVCDGQITAQQVVDTCGSGHGALAGVLTQLQADALICGGIGGGAQTALAQAGIRLYGGVSGDADQAVEALLAGKLEFNPQVQCNHHDHHHGQEHVCGDHGCGNGHCGGHH